MPSPDALVRPWRMATLIASGVAGIRLLQGVQLTSFNAIVPSVVALPFTDTFSSDPAGALSSSWFTQAGTIAIQSGAAVNTVAAGEQVTSGPPLPA